MKGPFLFCVLDGWGVRRGGAGDARALATTPFLDGLERSWPHAALAASGRDVGLPDGVMGNSEVGHLNLGAGRVVDQELVRIDRAVAEDSLTDNPVLRDLAARARDGGGRLHLLGLVSDGRVHSSDRHLAALLRAAARLGLGGDRTVVHAFTDGRDTPPSSAPAHLERLVRACGEAGAGVVGTVSGRFYAMDRDRRWDRTEKAWRAIALGEGPRAADPLDAIRRSHASGVTDEFVEPVVIDRAGGPLTIGPKDAVLHANFRPDRARQLVRALMDPAFDGFDRGAAPRPAALATITMHDESFPWPVAFPPSFVRGTLGEAWAGAGLRQLRIAETEKYAHVTYFFSGRDEKPFEGEERVLVPSPKVATYDRAPAMSAVAVTERLLDALRSGRFGAVVLNYANPDMVGHTGSIPATVEALATVDACLARVVPAVLAAGGACVITADHGNCEEMLDAAGGVVTAHSLNPVPAILVGPPFAGRTARSGPARLADVAPTVLRAMGLPVPAAMTGTPLVG
ncbi:MAG TPA: 2,3-bisphosphoglycerate-independent phosphoglycerate mutase [Planctomycetota bacterium]|nr:2,3-bisphosphoglycerate-independent phosphoglycerate mutase [Planctomycetota bacterium]